MGIRFYCPNGHKLHVKEFLAGKRGICPRCQGRFRIPRESLIPAGAPKVRPSGAPEFTEVANLASTGFDSHSVDAKLHAPGDVVVFEEQTEPQEAGFDALDEQPDAVWYVRPASGGQYGPAPGDVFRNWIDEGRVAAESLVWREGWAEWKSAHAVFPRLGPFPVVSEDQSLNESSSPDMAPPPPGDAATAVRPRLTARRRRASLLPLFFLGLTTLVLLVVLVTILQTK